MKLIKLLVILILVTVVTFSDAQTPFNKGVNLTGWFQVGSARQISFTKFTKKDFERIKSLGCDVIRLPINLHYMTNGAPDYTIDPLFYYFLDQVVDWTEELQLHLILDNHTFDPAAKTDPTVGSILVKVWKQMANHYKDRSNLIYYEVLNEPHDIADKTWNDIQKIVIDTIRTVDTKHTIVVGPAGWNSYNNLKYMPAYADTNLIYTFHFYDPFLFTHQGATWTSPSMGSLAGVPFPYNAAKIPACPADLKGTWICSSLTSSYANEGTEKKVKQLIDIAVSFQTTRKVRIFCGEFGVYIPNSDNSERVNWYDMVRKYLEEKGIAWTIWDYTGGFGLFEAGSNEMFDYDLNTPLVSALGFEVPPQMTFTAEPDTKGFMIYDDYAGENINASGNSNTGIIDLYDDYSYAGEFSIYCSGIPQYTNVGFDFKPNKDMSKLVSNNYLFDFWMLGNSPTTKFDIRFIDTKTTDPNDHPWRMKVTIDKTIVPFDAKWHHIIIPLKKFIEQGSWDNNQWFNPIGAFDWKAVDRLEIVSEHHAFTGIELRLDNILITEIATQIGNELNSITDGLEIIPNPVNSTTEIRFHVVNPGLIQLEIFDLSGKKIKTLVNEKSVAGTHSVMWDRHSDSGATAGAGIYICRLSTSQSSQSVKLSVMD